MLVAAVAHAVPSQRLTNDDVLALIARSNPQLDAAAMQAIRVETERLWASTGTAVRYVRAAGERAIDFCLDAARRALDESGVEPDDVDVVLYTGVARGWIEPAMANTVIHELGLRRATGFDVLDACASWLRALQLARMYLRDGVHRTVLVVNCEFSSREFFDRRFDGVATLAHGFASLTVGEAATATVLTADAATAHAATAHAAAAPDVERGGWHFAFRNFPEGRELCVITLPGVEQFRTSPVPMSTEPLMFRSRSRELVRATSRRIVETYLGDPALAGGCYDVVFGHAAGDGAALLVCRRMGIAEDRLYRTHAAYGNTVSASVPLAMSLAMRDGTLRRGMRVLVVVGSAGISVGLAAFVF